VFFVAAFLLLILLPSPWSFVGFACCLVAFLGEVSFWHHRVRGKRKVVGAQTLIGQVARVVSPCRPRGQVRVSGEIWAARCDEGAGPGEEVTVVGRDELTLIVERVTPAGP
jgi:membrane protein implicated in regulation of membrane protease activity